MATQIEIERVIRLLQSRGENYRYFFLNANEPMWIPHLKASGLFNNPPEVERTEDGGFKIPDWPPIYYLERVFEVPTARDEVLNILDELPETTNPRVLEGIVNIVLKSDDSINLVRFSEKLLAFVAHCHWGHEKIIRLVDMLSFVDGRLGRFSEAFLFKVVAFQPDHQAEEKQARRRADPQDWTILTKITDFQEYEKVRKKLDQEVLEPQAHFNEWEYQEILEKGVRPLSQREPYRVARILIDATATMIRLTFHQDELEEVGSKDYSTSWCKRVDETNRHYQDARENLVRTLTFACEKVYEKAPESVSALDQALRNQRWDIFTRIRQHLYALHLTEQTKPWIRELILTHKDYAKWQHHFEFQRMIRLACERFGADLLTRVERERIFKAILSGPSEQDFREFVGDQFTEESFEKRKHYFHRAQLSPFGPVLFDQYADYFQELKSEEEKPVTDDDYAPYRFEGVRSGEERSPKPVDELARMPDEELLSFLNDWKDVHFNREEWWVDTNFRGLAQAFKSIFKEVILTDEARLKFWTDNRDRIQRPIYVRAMVSVVHERVKSRQFESLDQWFELCEWVLSHPDQPKEEGVNRIDESKEHPDWESSRRAVGDFIEMCVEKDVNAPLSAREHLAALLSKLCTQYDRWLDDDEPVLLNRNDPLTEAINNTRSRALKDLINFGYWVRRQLGDDVADTPEVFAILEKRIGAGCERQLTLPEYALLGQRYIHIWVLNNEWAAERKRDFFPQENVRAWVEAFGNFLKYTRPYRPTFDLLLDDIEFALENIEKFKIDSLRPSNITDTLGEHLFIYYLRGVYPLTGDGSLLERFYEKTQEDRNRWSHLFDYVGRVLAESGGQLEEDLKQRGIEFFNWRFDKKEPSELKKFRFWLEAECLDAKWRLTAYSKILGISGPENIGIYTQMNTLRGMLEDHTALVVECFAKLTDSVVKNRSNFYIQPDKAKPILWAGLNSEDDTVRANAERARENLLKDERFDFLDEEN